jgi:hypothetical protein
VRTYAALQPQQWVRKRIVAGEFAIQQMDVQTYFFRRTNMDARVLDSWRRRTPPNSSADSAWKRRNLLTTLRRICILREENSLEITMSRRFLTLMIAVSLLGILVLLPSPDAAEDGAGPNSLPFSRQPEIGRSH